MVEKGAFDGIARRIELIRGELREMSPAGPIHDGIIQYLTIWSCTNAPNCSASVRVQSGLDLSELESRPEPDVLWVDDKRYLDRHPGADHVRLAIEVAHSSLASDMTEKAQLYAESGIPEYWVVDVEGKSIHVFSSPSDDSYLQRRTIPIDADVSPVCCPDAVLSLADLFGRS